MALAVVLTIQCDPRRGSSFTCPCVFYALTDTLPEARAQASRAGWERTGGRDLCPDHRAR